MVRRGKDKIRLRAVIETKAPEASVAQIGV